MFLWKFLNRYYLDSFMKSFFNPFKDTQFDIYCYLPKIKSVYHQNPFNNMKKLYPW